MPPDPETPPAAAPGPPSGRVVLFVCTGNTCRSPLAEALCRRRLADRLGCPPADLPARGFVIASAGVYALPGDHPSPAAVVVAAEYGADLAGHRSRPVNPELLAGATDVVTMTWAHAAALVQRFPAVGPDPQLLCGPAADLPDPIGGGLDVYRACAGIIVAYLDRMLDAWLGPGTAAADISNRFTEPGLPPPHPFTPSPPPSPSESPGP